MRKRRNVKAAEDRRPQSDLDSQLSEKQARFSPWPKTLPRDYPKQPNGRLPRFKPWPKSLPSDYPGTDYKRRRQARLPDIRVVERLENKNAIAGSIKPAPFVLSNFDARPINCIDFVDTFTTAEQAGGDTFIATFNVPQGRVGVFRRLQLRVYMSAAARDAVTGAPTEVLNLSFAINGNAVDQFNNIRVDDAICSPTFTVGLDIPLYFIAPPESSVTITINNTAGGTVFAFVAPILSGNLLLAEGVNLNSEPGTQNPLPTLGL